MNRTPLKLMDSPKELPRECCAKCHFVTTKETDKGTEYACRRYPPDMLASLKPVQDALGNMGFGWETASAHPAVRAERWCGEFKPWAHSTIAQ